MCATVHLSEHAVQAGIAYETTLNETRSNAFHNIVVLATKTNVSNIPLNTMEVDSQSAAPKLYRAENVHIMFIAGQ